MKETKEEARLRRELAAERELARGFERSMVELRAALDTSKKVLEAEQRRAQGEAATHRYELGQAREELAQAHRALVRAVMR